MLPDPLHVRHEARHEQDIKLAASVGLVSQMYAGALPIERSRSRIGRRRRAGLHERLGRGFGRNPKFNVQPLFQRRMMPLCRISIAGQQKAADQVAAIDFAQRIELDETPRMGGRGKILAGSDLVLHDALQRIHEPSSQRFAAKEHPIVELRAIAHGEAGKKVAPVDQASLFERTALAGALEPSCVTPVSSRGCLPPAAASGLYFWRALLLSYAVMRSPLPRLRAAVS